MPRQQRGADAMGLAEAERSGLVVLDPRSEPDRYAVDAHFQAAAAGWAGLDPVEVAQRTAEYIAQVGIVPPSLRGGVRGALRSGRDEQKLVAAALIDRISASKPAALEDFDEQDRKSTRLNSSH